jgi:hypothetical protein
MLQLVASIALLVAVVGSATVWSWKAGLRDQNRKEH